MFGGHSHLSRPRFFRPWLFRTPGVDRSGKESSSEIIAIFRSRMVAVTTPHPVCQDPSMSTRRTPHDGLPSLNMIVSGDTSSTIRMHSSAARRKQEVLSMPFLSITRASFRNSAAPSPPTKWHGERGIPSPPRISGHIGTRTARSAISLNWG